MIILLSAGWIGNDAVSPIIGKHDPYYHLTGRVSTEIIVKLNLFMSFQFIQFLRFFASGARRSSLCSSFNDFRCVGICPLNNCNCSPNSYGDICSQGKQELLY